MRRTVTLDADVATRLEELAQRRSTCFNRVPNDVLRKWPRSEAASRKPPVRFVVEPHARGFRPGINPEKLNRLVDEFEVGGDRLASPS